MAQTIDEEVHTLIDVAYKSARRVITENMAKLNQLSKYLLENETAEVDALERVWSGPSLAPDPAPGA